jgi:hypothetical protein
MKLETVKRRVQKYYPNSKCYSDLGLFYIGIKDSYTDEIINLFEEYFIPLCVTEEEAWNKALICCKTTQNFNRTHPDKISEVDELKMVRLKTRAKKIHETRFKNKSKIFIND